MIKYGSIEENQSLMSSKVIGVGTRASDLPKIDVSYVRDRSRTFVRQRAGNSEFGHKQICRYQFFERPDLRAVERSGNGLDGRKAAVATCPRQASFGSE